MTEELQLYFNVVRQALHCKAGILDGRSLGPRAVAASLATDSGAEFFGCAVMEFRSGFGGLLPLSQRKCCAVFRSSLNLPNQALPFSRQDCNQCCRSWCLCWQMRWGGTLQMLRSCMWF